MRTLCRLLATTAALLAATFMTPREVMAIDPYVLDFENATSNQDIIDSWGNDINTHDFAQGVITDTLTNELATVDGTQAIHYTASLENDVFGAEIWWGCRWDWVPTADFSPYIGGVFQFDAKVGPTPGAVTTWDCVLEDRQSSPRTNSGYDGIGLITLSTEWQTFQIQVDDMVANGLVISTVDRFIFGEGATPTEEPFYEIDLYIDNVMFLDEATATAVRDWNVY